MAEYEFSEHAFDMLKERDISENWVKSTIEAPDIKESKDDGAVHYIKSIQEHGGRYLRVVVNPDAKPQRVVTLFFDRRLRRQR